MKPRITLKNLSSRPALTQTIEEQTQHLSGQHPSILDCHVTVELPHRHQQQGATFKVTVSALVPGYRAVGSVTSADMTAAVRDAFRVLHRELASHAGRRRSHIATEL